MGSTTYGNSLVSQRSSWPLKPAELPVAIPLVLTFSQVINQIDVSLQASANCQISNISTIYVDNTKSPSRTTITFPVGGESVVVEAFSSGFYAVLTNALSFSVFNSTKSGATVLATVYNFQVPPTLLSSNGTVIGSLDTVLPQRVATNFFSGNALTGTASQIIPVSGESYYVTNLQVSYAGNAVMAGLWTWQVYDTVDPAGAILPGSKIFASGVLVTTTTLSQFQLASVDNIQMSGGNALWIASQNASGGPAGGSITANAWGGFSASNPT